MGDRCFSLEPWSMGGVGGAGSGLRCSGLRSQLAVQTWAIWSWLGAERRASGPFCLHARTSGERCSETFSNCCGRHKASKITVKVSWRREQQKLASDNDERAPEGGVPAYKSISSATKHESKFTFYLNLLEAHLSFVSCLNCM